MPLDTSKPSLQSVGDYDLIEKIAEGGMGTIYKGRNRNNGQIVAVKIVPQHLANNTVLLRRFEQEFRAARMLDHPNIVQAMDFGQSGNMPFLVMEFVEGESLGQKLERDGKLPEAEAIRLIAQAAQGLHRAHKQNLIHRDVKPDNIMVTPEGVAKLADLGLVKEAATDLNLTRTGRGLGTPHFMAPEQFRNAKNADVRCDIYSLGATLYMMVTGELPFKSCGPLDAWMKKVHNEITAPRKLVPSLSERVDWAIRRAMSADPTLRPASCREFVEDLTGHSTRRPGALDPAEVAAQDVWYLVYVDDEGTKHTVKGSTQGIRRSLKEGLLGDASNVRASREKKGPFEPLRTYPEFRDMVIEPAPLTPRSGSPLSNPPAAPPPPRSNGGAKETTPGPAPARPNSGSYGPAPRIPIMEDEPLAGASMFSIEWLKWIILVVIALVTAVATFYFF